MGLRKGKRYHKGKGKYLKYRNGPGSTRPQRTGKNKKSGPDTGDHVVATDNRRKRIASWTRFVIRHRDPLFAARNLVPRKYTGPVMERLKLVEEVDIFGGD